jgi:hypothetical protein
MGMAKKREHILVATATLADPSPTTKVTEHRVAGYATLR